MPIPVGSCEVWFQYTLTGDSEPMYTHIAYDLADAPDQASVDAGFTAWQTLWRNDHTSDVQLIGGHVLVGSDPGTIRWDSAIAAVAGTASGTSVPQNTAILIKKVTGSGGRRNRGRMFVPCVPEAYVDSAGNVSGVATAAWNANAAGLLIGGAIHTAFGFLGQPQLLHETGSQTPTQITDLSCQLKVATQRRRLRR